MILGRSLEDLPRMTAVCHIPLKIGFSLSGWHGASIVARAKKTNAQKWHGALILERSGADLPRISGVCHSKKTKCAEVARSLDCWEISRRSPRNDSCVP